MTHMTRINRRTFVKSVAYAGALAPLTGPRLVRAVSPNGKLRFAGIGVDNMGWSDVSQIGGYARTQVVALCDVDTTMFAKAAEAWPDAARFQDFRQMFDRMGKDIDAVNVTIPDHMHAYVAMHAMRAGKHVYCQKPLTHTVWEARQMATLAAKQAVVTRMGNQIHSHIAYRLVVRVLRDGVIGKVRELHSWVDHGGHTFLKQSPGPGHTDPVPDTLDWDLWLGGAPRRPFVTNLYHPRNWRAWKDFGGGGLGDFGCHILDPPFTALELTAPNSIVAEQEGMTDQHWPRTSKVSYVFPGTAYTAGDQIAVTWYDGGRKPDRSLATDMPAEQELPAAGTLFIGTEGQMVLPHFTGPRVFPVEKHVEYLKNRPDLGERHHWHDWVDTCLEGNTNAPDSFAYAGPLTETVNLGQIAVKLAGQPLQWDAEAMKIPNNAAANAMLTTEYRQGYHVTPA